MARSFDFRDLLLPLLLSFNVRWLYWVFGEKIRFLSLVIGTSATLGVKIEDTMVDYLLGLSFFISSLSLSLSESTVPRDTER